MNPKKLLARQDLSAARFHFENACRASRKHQELVRLSLEEHGDRGSQISGIIRDHFPEHVKNRLRNLCRTITTESDRAWAARPPRVRTETMRRLASAVAQRDGSGFYGPRA